MSSLFRSGALLEVTPPPEATIINVTGAVYEFSLSAANQYRWSAAVYSFTNALASASFNIALSAEVTGSTNALAVDNVNPAMTIGIREISNANAIAQVNRPAPTQDPDSCFIFPYNRWSDKNLGTISASSEISMYPASNTQKSQRSKVWRSNAETSAYIKRDLGSAYRINSIVLVSHNATNTGKFRVRIGNDSTFTNNLYDSGYLDTWEKSFATSGITSEFAESDGRPTNATIELLRYCSENARTVRWIVFNEVAARYIRIDFQDPDNTLGWNEVAWIYAGLVVNINPTQIYGWILEFNTINRVRISASGQYWIDDLYKQVKATATLASRPQDQILGFWFWLYQKLGLIGEFVISFQPENLPKKFFFSMYCHFTEIADLEQVGFGTFSTNLNIEELL